MPLVAPPIGGVLGAGLYKAMVELHHPTVSEQDAGVTKGLEEETDPLGKHGNTCADECV